MSLTPDLSRSAPLLELDGVTRWYRLGSAFAPERRYVRAVTDVSFAIQKGETVGLIGESGCGKTTLGRAIIGLAPLNAGTIRLRGEAISGLSDRNLRPARAEIQMVWQNAASAVNQRKRVDRIIREPLDVHHVGTRDERQARVQRLLELVSLRPEFGRRYPHELSGGQLQRVIIARAIALDPKLLVCDEPTSSLDVSIRAQIVNLLDELSSRMNMAMLYISHDLRTVSVLSDRILVMYLGRIVEEIPRSSLHVPALHPYTRGLIDSVPVADPEQRRGEPPVMGEVPSATSPPSGCAYHPRCPLAQRICGQQEPALIAMGQGRWVACHAVGGGYRDRWRAEHDLSPGRYDRSEAR